MTSTLEYTYHTPSKMPVNFSKVSVLLRKYLDADFEQMPVALPVEVIMMILSHLDSEEDKATIAQCRQASSLLNQLGAPVLYRNLSWQYFQRNPLSAARASSTERDQHRHIQAIEMNDHPRSECPRLTGPSTRQIDLGFPILRLNVGVLHDCLGPKPAPPHWSTRCLSSAAPYCPLMKGLAPSKVILGTPLWVSSPPTLGRLDQSRLEELVVILDCDPRYWYAVKNLKSPLIGLRTRAKQCTIIFLTDGPETRVGGFKRYGEIAAWVENVCQGIAEMALDGGNGGVVTVVNAGAIRPGDVGLDNKADHVTTQHRVEEVCGAELARVKGRIVTPKGGRWKSRKEAEKVEIKFVDMGTYLPMPGSREDLEEEQRKAWRLA
jgi:hypothetical protein